MAIPASATDDPGANDNFRLLADNLPILCWMAQADGAITWYNRRWYEYTGTVPGQMDGWNWQAVHDPGELPSVLAAWRLAIATGEPFEMVFPLRGADGLYRPFLTRVSPWRDAGGKVRRWFGSNTEIGAQLKAEAALSESEARLAVLTNAMPQMIWSTRPDGFHDYYNARWYEFTGMPPGSTDGEGWADMFHPDDQDRAWDSWRQSLASGEPYEVQYRLRHNSGEWRWVLGRALPVRDSDGRIVRWFGTCTDIHDTKRTAQSNELLSRELSHRIKNIFAVIGGLVRMSARRAPEARAYAAELQARIAALGRAHEFARPHSEISRPVVGATDLVGLLSQLFEPYSDENGERVRITGDNVPVDDRGATPLALLFHELATNAAKHGALSVPEGHVALAIRADDEMLHFEWQEHGGPTVPGAPKETGFGTQLAHLAVVQQLGGQISARWAAAGLGMTISVSASRLVRRAAELQGV